MHLNIGFFFYLTLLSSPCHAYIDGGNSSMLLQLILGGGVAVAGALKMYWHKVFAFFKRRHSQQTQTDHRDLEK